MKKNLPALAKHGSFPWSFIIKNLPALKNMDLPSEKKNPRTEPRAPGVGWRKCEQKRRLALEWNQRTMRGRDARLGGSRLVPPTLARELQRLVLTYAHSLSSAHAAPFLPEQCLFPTGGWAEGCSPFQRFLCGVRGKRVKEGQES